jgi:hypothetical protein
MKLCQNEIALESSGQCSESPPRRPETERRFRIVKLEERIAPGGFHRTYDCTLGCTLGGPHCYTHSLCK